MTGINTQTNGDFHGLVELALGGLQRERNRLVRLIDGLLDQLCAVLIFLTMLHGSIPPVSQSSTVTPIERAVPATMLIAASMEAALRSGILVVAISRT